MRTTALAMIIASALVIGQQLGAQSSSSQAPAAQSTSSKSDSSVATSRLRFSVTLDPAAADKPLSGRLLIYMSQSKPKNERFEPGFGPDTKNIWIAAREVSDWKPGDTIEVDPDEIAFPQPFSKAPQGSWYATAVLDADHNAAYTVYSPGDIVGSLESVESLNPAEGGIVRLTLKQPIPPAAPQLPEGAQRIEFVSPSLSRFFGREITMHAVAVFPPSYSKSAKKYPAVYVNHGYTATMDTLVKYSARPVAKAFAEKKLPEMVYFFLLQEVPGGTHEFADSVNNGPWGHALTRELIPYLEKKYRLDARPQARFLTGHSSGGWATAWLQVAYPKFFGGAWATSPDPLDFRSFTGPNIAAEHPQNVYRKPDGSPWMLVRMDGKDTQSFEDFAKQERVLGDYGGQMASFEWVFSPRGEDGRPKELFDRSTGSVDPRVAKYWSRYDISNVLAKSCKQLGPSFAGKLRVIVGDQDTFHLDEPTRLFQQRMNEVGCKVQVEYIPGRDHFDLYKGGLEERIAKEMWQTYQKSARTVTSSGRSSGQH